MQACTHTHLSVPSWISVDEAGLLEGVQASPQHAVQQGRLRLHVRVVAVHVAQHHTHLTRPLISEKQK